MYRGSDAGKQVGDQLLRYFVTDGVMGEAPDWLPYLIAAKELGCTPWELYSQPTFWLHAALTLQSSRNMAEEQMQNIQNAKNNMGGQEGLMS